VNTDEKVDSPNQSRLYRESVEKFGGLHTPRPAWRPVPRTVSGHARHLAASGQTLGPIDCPTGGAAALIGETLLTSRRLTRSTRAFL
jgi:hypothetical protein